MMNKKTEIELYLKMYLSRKAESRIRELYNEDVMKTPMHMSMGEEAVVIGVVQALNTEDQVFGTYRSHSLYLSKTQNTDDFFAEMYGKNTALLKGKGGSMHMCAPDYGFMGASAIVASIIPVAIGAAFANKIHKNNKIAAVFFGDGAIDEGDFWESLNSACLMKLPILFVCEDNGLAVHTPPVLRHGYKSITKIVSKFDCNVLSSDSTDVGMIYKLANKAIKLMRKNGMPCFLHLKYYRYLEHVGINEDFKDGYRDKSDFDEWYQRDPVNFQRIKLIEKQIIPEGEICALEDKIAAKIDDSIRLAKDAEFSNSDELLLGVFS